MIQFFKLVLYQPLFNLLILLIALIPGHQVGWAIIILTILIRLVLLPTTVHTAKVQIRMRELQPKIDVLRKEHKNDKTLQSQALMALYKEEGVSPFSSCLPLIVQVVVLLVLYYVFRDGLSTAHFDQLYSFTKRPESINTNFFGIDLAKPEPWILPIIAAITQFWQAKVTFIPSGNPDDPTAAISRQMVYIAPVMTLFFARSFPAALPLYWAVQNLFSVAQQEYIMKRRGLVSHAVPKPIREAEKQVEREHQIEKTEQKKSGITVTVRKRN